MLVLPSAAAALASPCLLDVGCTCFYVGAIVTVRREVARTLPSAAAALARLAAFVSKPHGLLLFCGLSPSALRLVTFFSAACYYFKSEPALCGLRGKNLACAVPAGGLTVKTRGDLYSCSAAVSPP